MLGSTVTGEGEKQAPAPGNSGFSDTGDGIYIEANYDYDVVLTIDGVQLTGPAGTTYRESYISSEYSYSLQICEPDADNVTVRIYSGVFDEEQKKEHLAEGSTQTEDGGIFIVTASVQ